MLQENEVKIRKANLDDLNFISEILNRCRVHLDSQGIPQWVPEYPNEKHVAEDIKRDEAFVLTVNKIVAAYVVINEHQDPEYSAIKWNYDGENVFVIHRLAVNPEYQRMGIAKRLMDFAEFYSVQEGKEAIRLDAFTLNKRVLRFYENRGYHNCGETYFPYRKFPFNCYEKRLNQIN